MTNDTVVMLSKLKQQESYSMTNSIKINNKVHYYWLDAIRFIAAFLVLLSHCRNTFFPEFGDLPLEQHTLVNMCVTLLCRLGGEAVIVFFVLSGFLVGGRGWENIKSGTMNVKHYAIDRFARIYPPLIFAVAFCGVTSYFTSKIDFEWTCAIGNLLHLQGICCKSLVSPFWSLGYEMWFYIILGTLAYLLLSKSDKSKLISFTVLLCSLSVFVLGLQIYRLLIWILGAVAYITRPKNKNVYVLIFSFLGLCVSVLYYQLSKDTHYLQCALTNTNHELIDILIAFMFCLFIQQVVLYKPKSRITKLIEKTLGSFAKFSYTLYLSHRIVFLWIIAYLWPENICDFSLKGILTFFSIIVFTTTCCYLIYLVSERYTPEVKSWLKKMI